MNGKLTTPFLVAILISVAGLYVVVTQIRKLHLEQNQQVAQLRRKDISITIVEGKRREEIATLLQQKGICSAADFLTASQGDEGYLFPDTYRFFPNTPAKEVVDTLLANFQKRLGSSLPDRTQLIIASIVEREAVTEAERPQIAGVYVNRLKQGMRLDADPTVQYAKDTLNWESQGQPLTYSFWKAITVQDYSSVQSPYNTYLTNGLPPGPIANPGQPSILAAEQPTPHDDLYFFQRNGQLFLSKTLQEHLAKQAQEP